jgi:hypothetical protein
MITGYSVNFLDSYKSFTKDKKQELSISFHGSYNSREFLNVLDLNESYIRRVGNVLNMTKLGGINIPLKIYDPSELYSKNNDRDSILHDFNFTNHMMIAEKKGFIEKNKNKINLKIEFFISLDDASTNEIFFGSKSKPGFLLDIDSSSLLEGKTTFNKSFSIIENANKMLINVDHISNNQSQRRSAKNDVGYYVSSNPGNYLSPIGLSGIDILLTRRNEIDNVPVV